MVKMVYIFYVLLSYLLRAIFHNDTNMYTHVHEPSY